MEILSIWLLWFSSASALFQPGYIRKESALSLWFWFSSVFGLIDIFATHEKSPVVSRTLDNAPVKSWTGISTSCPIANRKCATILKNFKIFVVFQWRLLYSWFYYYPCCSYILSMLYSASIQRNSWHIFIAIVSLSPYRSGSEWHWHFSGAERCWVSSALRHWEKR